MAHPAFILLLAGGFLALPSEAQQTAVRDDLPKCVSTLEPPIPENMIRPKYPKNALRNGIGGKVEVRAAVAPSGKIDELTVVNSESEFSASAIKAIRQWRFRAMAVAGHPVESTYRVHVRFDPLLQEANSDVELESPQVSSSTIPASAVSPEEVQGENAHLGSEPGLVEPKPLYSPEPEFSEKARKAAEQGTVSISLKVGTDGLPRDLRLVCSSATDLNENAMEAVKRWKFAPGTRGGKPIIVQIEVEVQFHVYSGR